MNCGQLSAAIRAVKKCSLYYPAAESLIAVASLAGREFSSGVEENSTARASLLKGFGVVNRLCGHVAILIV